MGEVLKFPGKKKESGERKPSAIEQWKEGIFSYLNDRCSTQGKITKTLLIGIIAQFLDEYKAKRGWQHFSAPDAEADLVPAANEFIAASKTYYSRDSKFKRYMEQLQDREASQREKKTADVKNDIAFIAELKRKKEWTADDIAHIRIIIKAYTQAAKLSEKAASHIQTIEYVLDLYEPLSTPETEAHTYQAQIINDLEQLTKPT